MATRKITKATRTRTIGILLSLTLLLLVGLVMVYDASVAEAERLFGNRYYFAERHLVWIVIGLVAMVVASRTPISWIKRMARVGFWVSIALLLLVLLPGFGRTLQGAQRWIRISSTISFQPSEFAKLATVLYVSAWFHKKPKPLHVFGLVGFLCGILLLQPDLGTALIIAGTCFTLWFVAGAPLGKILGGGVLGLLMLALIILSSPYRQERLHTFLNPDTNLQGASYHFNQILISLGSGGTFGLGLGRSRQKFQYLPEASTDSVFAVIGEELGFVGTTTTIILYLVLLSQLFRTANREQNEYRRLALTGITAWFTIQTLVNMGSMVGIFPLTGVPLPFISYGGSSLIAQLTAMGIAFRISLTQT